MKTYPCILESKSEHDNRIMLAFNKNECQCINSEQMSSYCGFDFDASDRWENITAEYLANTYGEVKSKEHAEFIVKLAEVNGLINETGIAKGFPCRFSFSNDEIYFFDDEVFAKDNDEKQITIPLPPECESVDEWPKVGDEVQTSDGVGAVKLLPDSKGYYVISIKDEYYQYQLDELSKPKTPEQELLDDIEYAIHHFEGDKVAGRKWLMAKYNITNKGEGDE